MQNNKEINSNLNLIDEDEELEEMVKTNLLMNQNREKIIFYEFLNFLEIYIHSILYLSNVYPKETFHEYKLYNLQFLKYNLDDQVNKHIIDFLSNLENLLFLRFVNKIYILIIDADSDTILEIFNLEIDFSNKFYNCNYEEIKLNFKSILYKLFLQYANKFDFYKDYNKTFSICIDTKEDRILNKKNYEECINSIEDNFVKNLFKKDILQVFKNREVCMIIDDINYSINISRNYI